MSERAMVRAAARRRVRRRARRAGLGAATAMAAAAVAAPGAGAIEVNSLADPGTGNCADGTCTLREAIAQADTTPSASDTITFKPGLTGTIPLNTTVGELDLTTPVSIVGPGVDQVTISGNSSTNFSTGVRVLYASGPGISVSGLTLTKGNGAPTGSVSRKDGGAVFAYETELTLDHVAITGNRTLSGKDGGGLYSDNSDLTITNSTFADNRVEGSYGAGGGMYVKGNGGGSLVLRDSTLTGNSIYNGSGAGVFIHGGTSSLIDHTTIADNLGTGLVVNTVAAAGPVVISDSTISGNGGGAILANAPAGITVQSSTISDNTSYGIKRPSAADALTISSSILADNDNLDLDTSYSATVPPTIGHSLVETRDTADAIQQTPPGSNLLGVDPQLGPLAANGGPTQTQAPALTSPVIDAGTANGLTTDQRGLPRTSDQPGPANATDGTDIGAVELQAPDTSVLAPNVSAAGKQKVKGSKLQVIVEAGAGEAVSATGSGSVQTGKSKGGKGKRAKPKAVALSASPIDVPAGTTAKLVLTPTKKSAGRKLAKKLSKGGKAKASITVTLTDAAGNSAQRTVTVKLKGAKKKKGKGKG